MKGKECSSENLNLTPMGDLRGRCLSFIIPLKDLKDTTGGIQDENNHAIKSLLIIGKPILIFAT